MTGAIPVPLSTTAWGLLLALSATVSVPCRKPTIVGANFTEILQLDRAARALGKMGQVLLGAYSARVVLILLIVNC